MFSLFWLQPLYWFHYQHKWGCLLQVESLQPVQPIDLIQSYSGMLTPSGLTQLLTALVIGLLTAFSFQVLLTSLGVAIGISLWQVRSPTHDSSHDLSKSELSKSESSSSNIGAMAGFSILLTVNIVLFSACFLAAKFSQIYDPTSGAIEGIVIWSAYFLMLIWVSSRAVGSLVGSLLDITTGGFRRIVSAIAAVFNQLDDEPINPSLSPSINSSLSEGEVVATVQQELQAMFSAVDLRQIVEEQLEAQLQSLLQNEVPLEIPLERSLGVSQGQLEESRALRAQQEAIATELWQTVEIYLHDTSVKSLTPKRIDRKLKKLLQQDEPLNQSLLPAFDRAQLRTILDQRADVTDKQKSRITQQVEITWQEVLQNHLGDRYPTSSSSAPSESAAEKPKLPTQLTAQVLQSALNATVERVWGILPELLQHVGIKMPSGAELAPIVLSIALAKLRDSFGSDVLNLLSLDHPELKQTLDRWLNVPQVSMTGLNALVNPVKYLRDRSLEQVESIQQAAQDGIETVKRQTQQRVEDTRKVAATAAWWLFLTASTGAASAAIAGALGAGFRF